MAVRKLLVVCSALDLSIELGATPAWWQLLKGLSAEGCEIVAIPYRGRAVPSLWWRCFDNPCIWEGEIFARTNRFVKGIGRKAGMSEREDRIVRRFARSVVRPKWKRLLGRILTTERDVDAVIFLNIPANHINGLPKYLRREFGVPVVYFDGDLPVSLPRYGGYTFNFYTEADLSEFDAFVVNSVGGGRELVEMGASRVHVLHYGADPEVYFPESRGYSKDVDVFYAGFGTRFREKWLHEMISVPSQQIEGSFVVSGPNFELDLGEARRVPKLEFSSWRRHCWRSRIVLNIARDSHALTPGTSSSRPFELACIGCCVVSNPYVSLGEWFEIGKEIIVVNDADEAVETYKWLLSDEEARKRIGHSARQRVLREHTFRHRARQLLGILDGIQ